jgi:uncharacterized protein
MKQAFIGRKDEHLILQKAFKSGDAEMVAVIGRRRVGKTFLVHHAYEGLIDFELSGVQDLPLRDQLENFTQRLNHHSGTTIPFKRPTSWSEAFQMLITYLDGLDKKEKLVIFFDELPWLASRRSNFLKWFGYFWNSWAVQKNIVVVICGSAASWMIANVVRDRGGLHNRITRRVALQPFTLGETEVFLQSRGANFDRYQILQLYMALGGIPHYLKEVEAGLSATQNIDRICFSASGLLLDEFSLLYPALFHNSEVHIQLIRVLATTWQGKTRAELLEMAHLTNGGNTSDVLDELETSGFISGYYAFGKRKKEMRYRLTDEFSLFYLQFMEKHRSEGAGTWEKLSQTASWKSWSGYAFESICLKHIAQIKSALSIAGVYSEASTFYSKATTTYDGVQIDLLIDRNDHVINVCELKFYNTMFVPTKSFATTLRTKVALFKAISGTNKQVFLTLITAFPMLPNEHSIGLIDTALTMDALFD